MITPLHIATVGGHPPMIFDEQEEPRGMSDNVIALRHDPDFGCHPCPACGHDAPVVGGFNAIDYIQCYRCGYYGDHWEEDGIVFDIPVPTEDGHRRVDEDAYRKRIAEIYQQARAASVQARRPDRGQQS